MFKLFVTQVVLLVTIIFVPVSSVSAVEFASGDKVILAPDEVIEGNYFVAGETVTISGTVNGDLYVAGGTVNIEGTVTGDILAAGGTVTIRGIVGEDIRVAGGQVLISGEIADDITIIGGSLTVADAAVIGDSVVATGGNISLFAPITGSISTAGGNVEIGNKVQGDVMAAVGNLALTPNASILGKLTYVSENEVNIPQGATVSGEIIRQQPPEYKEKVEQDVEMAKNTAKGASVTLKIINLLSAFLVGFIAIHFFPTYVGHITNRILTSPWQSIGIGFLTLLFAPIAIILMFITVIGMPIAFIALFAYFFYIYIAKIFVSIVLGITVLNFFKKKYSQVANLAVGLVIYLLLSSIPFIGWLVSLVTVAGGIGAIILAKKDYYSELKLKKLI